MEADSVASAMKILAGEKLGIVLLDIDVIVLAKYYLDKVNVKRRGQHLVGLSPEVDKIFRNYQWSGNVRELRNVIERASILEDGDTVTPTH